MRIEIKCGGLSGAAGLRTVQSDFNKFVNKQETVLKSFRTVQQKTCNARGGVGNMRNGLNSLESRIRLEERKQEALKAAEKQVSQFVTETSQVDSAVAQMVKKNKNAFYRKYPRLNPSGSQEDESIGQKVWAWLQGAGEKISQGVKNAWQNVKTWVTDMKNSIVSFYQEHKTLIDTIGKVLLTVVIVVGAVVGIIATCGGGLAVLAPLLAAIGLSASAAATLSAVLVVSTAVATGLAAIMDVADLWLDVDHPVFNFFQVTFNIVSFAGNLFTGVGKSFNIANSIDLDTGFRIRNLAKTNMKEAMELAVQDRKTNVWYLKNLADGQGPNFFKNSANIAHGFKYGDETTHIIKWHSRQMNLFNNPSIGATGGGWGWTAQLSFADENGVFHFLEDTLTWTVNRRSPLAHIKIYNIPAEGLFSFKGWAFDNLDKILHTWLHPFK